MTYTLDQYYLKKKRKIEPKVVIILKLPPERGDKSDK